MKGLEELERLAAEVARKWACDSSRYPKLANMSRDERREYLLRHSAFHVSKTSGKISALFENADHVGAPVSLNDLRYQIGKMLLNTLKFAEEANMSVGSLMAEAENALGRSQ